MRHGSLFSGIGGFDLAAQWMGWENVFQVEKDEWCIKLLAKNFPSVKRYFDIKMFSGNEYENKIDIISAGFPCQPFSIAGKQRGADDDRYLWPETIRVISAIRPAFVVCENVTGIIRMELDKVLSDLALQGYTSETFIIPACAKNAWHRRDRVWIVSYKNTNSIRCNGGERKKESCKRELREFGTGSNEWFYSKKVSSNTNSQRFQSSEYEPIENGESATGQRPCFTSESWWESEPGMGRVVNGLPGRVDRIKGLGNAIVPQVALQIFKAIQEYENQNQ